MSTTGFSIRSIPQMGGTSTTQQAIYLAHNTQCGINPFLENKIGTTTISYIDFSNILQDAISDPATQPFFQQIVDAFLQIQQDPSDQNEYALYDAYYKYGQAMWDVLSGFQVDGYLTTFTLYDEEGRTFFDSTREGWFPVFDVGGGVLAPVQLLLVPLAIQLPVPGGGIYKLNPTGSQTASLYNISKTPSYQSYIINALNPITQRQQSEIFFSGFVLNQAQMFESLMASMSLLTDTANTRFFNRINTGYSARPVSPGSGNLGYYTCTILNITNESRITNQTFYVRLGLEKIIS